MKIIKNIILILLIFILINVVYSKYVKKEPLIKLFKKSFLIVSTGSMEPTINTEEIIIIAEQDKYEEGDIVTFIDEEGFIITHRIVKINESSFITKGDANNITDKECNISSIQGKVIFHSKIIGFFVIYLLKPLICIYLIISVISEIVKNYKVKKQEEILTIKE